MEMLVAFRLLVKLLRQSHPGQNSPRVLGGQLPRRSTVMYLQPDLESQDMVSLTPKSSQAV